MNNVIDMEKVKEAAEISGAKNLDVKNMTAKEYLNIATNEYLSGMAVIADNVPEGEEFGMLEAVCPIKGNKVIKLTLEVLENDRANEENHKEINEEKDAEEASDTLKEFGLSLCSETTEGL